MDWGTPQPRLFHWLLVRWGYQENIVLLLWLLHHRMRGLEVKKFFVLFFSQVVAYALITINYRFIAQAGRLGAVTTDGMIGALNFWLIRRIANTETTSEWFGYTLGCMAGSLLGITISVHLGK